MFAAIALALSPVSANACQTAYQELSQEQSNLAGYLKRYVNCLSATDGTDDCSFEFRRVKSAQYDFETAVSNYKINCS